MEDRESPFSRSQPSRGSIRSQFGRKSFATEGQRQVTPRQTKEASPRSTTRFKPAQTALENLKQWELVEGDRGLRVVEKKGSVSPRSSIVEQSSSPKSLGPPTTPKKTAPANFRIDPSLQEKLKAFKDSKIIQPIAMDPGDTGVPVSLDLILNQQKASAVESTDMLQRLELQVKAIEMGTLAARTTRPLEVSSDFEPEVQLRYREHEDLLRNVTDDEAEG